MTTRLTAALLLTAAVSMAESPISFTATSANVAGAPDSIRINVIRWSTDAERDQLLAAWSMAAPASATTTATAGRGGGRGAARGGADPAPDPSADDDTAAPAAAAARGGRGAGGGRGGGRAGAGRGGAAPVAPQTPEGSLAAALQKAPTVGYLWSSEVAGYSLRYAGRFPLADGGERIVLITERRLGAWNELWKPAAPDPPTNYEFSVVELRLNSKGEGEGKASLTGKAALDSSAKTIGLENYGGLPVILKNVRRKTL